MNMKLSRRGLFGGVASAAIVAPVVVAAVDAQVETDSKEFKRTAVPENPYYDLISNSMVYRVS